MPVSKRQQWLLTPATLSVCLSISLCLSVGLSLCLSLFLSLSLSLSLSVPISLYMYLYRYTRVMTALAPDEPSTLFITSQRSSKLNFNQKSTHQALNLQPRPANLQTPAVNAHAHSSNPCRGASLMRNSGRLGPYSETMPRALLQSQGNGQLLMRRYPCNP